MQAEFEDSLGSSSDHGLFCLQGVVDKLADSKPHKCTLKFTFIQPGNGLRIHSDSFQPYDRVEITISNSRDAKTGDRQCVTEIFFPRMERLPFQLTDKPPSSTKLALQVRFRGEPTRHNDSMAFNASEQLSYLFEGIEQTVTPLLESRTFSSLAHLSNDVASALMQKRADFATFDLEQVGVRSYLVAGGGTTAKASATCGAISDNSGEHNAQTVIPEKPKPKLDPDPTTAQSTLWEASEPVSTEPKTTDPDAPDPSTQGLDTLEDGDLSFETPRLDGQMDRVFVALGSNVGDRLGNIEAACREMDAEPDIQVLRTSSLYETDAMYVTDQASFLNGACEVSLFMGRDTKSYAEYLDWNHSPTNGTARQVAGYRRTTRPC